MIQLITHLFASPFGGIFNIFVVSLGVLWAGGGGRGRYEDVFPSLLSERLIVSRNESRGTLTNEPLVSSVAQST